MYQDNMIPTWLLRVPAAFTLTQSQWCKLKNVSTLFYNAEPSIAVGSSAGKQLDLCTEGARVANTGRQRVKDQHPPCLAGLPRHHLWPLHLLRP